MKPLLFVLMTCTAVLAADPAVKSEPAEELLKVTRYESLAIDSAMSTFDGFIKQMAEQGIPAAAVDEIRQEARLMYERIFNDPAMHKKVVGLYNDHFTQEELVELTEFYRTGLGQKTLAAMPSIMSEAVQLAMPALQKEMPTFQGKLADIVKKHKKTEEKAAE